MPTSWNYPEAYFLSETYVKNLTGVTSKARTNSADPILFWNYTPGNATFETVDLEDYYHSINAIGVAVSNALFLSCNPDLDLVKQINVNDIKTSLANIPGNLDKSLSFGWGSNGNNYMKIVTNITNFYIHDYLGASFPFAAGGSATDELYILSTVWDNWVSQTFLIFAVLFEKVVIENATFENSVGHAYPLMSGYLINNLELSQIKLKNFTGTSNPVTSLISYTDFGTSTYTFDGFTIENWRFLKSSLFFHPTSINFVTLTNMVIANSTISSGQSLMTMAQIKHAVISNYTVDGFTASDTDNSETVLLRINSIDLQSSYDTELYEVRDL
jgi:hypothetical protein